MNCQDCQRQLNAWLDDELDPIAAADVDRHIRTCAACAARAEALRSLSAAVKAPSFYAAAPTGLEDRVRLALRREVTAAPRRLNGPMRWSAIAAAILLAGFIGWRLPRGPAMGSDSTLAAQTLSSQILSAHLRSLMADHLLDVTSSDRHTVKPWFAGKIDFSPDVRDCAAEGFPLVGGRLEYLDDQPVAALVYRHDKHVINVFVWPARAQAGPQPAITRNGYHQVSWEAQGLVYWTVSDASEATLRDLQSCLTSLDLTAATRR